MWCLSLCRRIFDTVQLTGNSIGILIQIKCFPATTNKKSSEESSNAKLFNATTASTSDNYDGCCCTTYQSTISFGF